MALKESVELTEMCEGYDGQLTRFEVLSFSPDIHEKPGVYLQHVEGCGYRVFELTPDEAEALGTILNIKAEESRKAFKAQT